MSRQLEDLIAAKPRLEPLDLQHALNTMACNVYDFNVRKGWYTDPKTGERIGRNIPEMLMLTVSELAEAMEGYRKDLMDDHLPHRKMIEVELADTLIRVFDLCGYLDLNIGQAVFEKWAYNAHRKDHTLAARMADNGKAF
jgi:NTP pyrophosphatase (non-canonical NTP hydrolase)